MATVDLQARAARVMAVVEAVGGKVIKRTRNTMLIQVPADVAPGLNNLG